MRKLLALKLGVALSVFSIVISCDDDNDENKPATSIPEIGIVSPTDLNGLQALVGSPLVFKLAVVAEAGLSTVSLSGTTIKTYAGTEKSDTLTYDFVATESGTVTLTFEVEDTEGIKASSSEVSVEVIGESGFLIADLGGEEGTSGILYAEEPTHWDSARVITRFGVNGSLTTSATHENVGNQFTLAIGVDNPDASATIEFQGKALKMVKQPADWNTDGWGHIIFDFESTFDQGLIEALPQVNAVLTGLTTGSKVIKMDVYFDDTQSHDSLKLSSLKAKTDVWNADPAKGYLIDLTLANYAIHRLNHDGAGMYIGYKGYITEANTWQTVTFDELDLGRVGNFLAAGDPGKESPSSSEIDAIRLVPGGGYGDGQSPNTIYFRNLRIADIQ